jgi:elongation factor P
MVIANDIAKGMIIKYNNEPYVVISKEFTAMGKGSAFNRCKIKNIRTGKILEQVYKSGEKVEDLVVTKATMQFIYTDSDNAYFMNPETFEQVGVPLDNVPGGTDYLHESGHYVISFYEGEVLIVEILGKIVLEVTETSDAVRGNTATNATKEAKLETGAKVQVPLFIKIGDKVAINPETGEYASKMN